jgi:hypothetical protein
MVLVSPGLAQEAGKKRKRTGLKAGDYKLTEWRRAEARLYGDVRRERRLCELSFRLAGLRLPTLGGRILLVALWPARSKARHMYQLATVR